QLRSGLGYDHVSIGAEPPPPAPAPGLVEMFEIRDAVGSLGTLIVDTRASGRGIDPREHEPLEMLAGYLAIAIRNARLYGQIAETKRSLEQLIASAGDAIVSIDAASNRIEGWNPAAERIFGLSGAEASGRLIGEVLDGASYEDAKRRLDAGG